MSYYIFESGIECSQFPNCQLPSFTFRSFLPCGKSVENDELRADSHLLLCMTVCRLFYTSLHPQDIVVGFRIPKW
jgi:hypothetical protein